VSGAAFINLEHDGLVIAVGEIVAVRALNDSDIDPRTGTTALGIPDDARTQIICNRGSYYVTADISEVIDLMQKAALAGGW
jgi:hypothetical protein